LTSKNYVKVLWQDLRNFTRECFLRVGVPKEDAELIADHLVLANLRGVDSHGVIRIPYYIEGIRKGYVKAAPQIKVVRESPTTTLIDGDNGLGIPIAVKATITAIDKAKTMGLSAVAVRNLGHVGMLAYYTLQTCRERLIGLATANGPALVAPWGGAERVFGTNPISFGFPTKDMPIVVDMATSAIAHFKIVMATLTGKSIPEGVALTKDGRPTTDANEAKDGILLPFGQYKGYAISLLVEILSAVISGAPLSKHTTLHPSTQGGFFVMALNPTAFIDYSEYLDNISKLVTIIKSCPPAQGFNEVLLPGERASRIQAERTKNGIPIEIEVWKKLTDISKELGVELPAVIE